MKRLSLLRILEFIAEKKLSFVQTLLALALITGIPLMLLYYYASRPGYDKGTATSCLLHGIAGNIGHDLETTGKSDLREVRKRFLQEYGDAPPLLWTKVEVISKDAEYEGRIICHIPKRYFGRFTRSTVCVALEKDPQRDEWLLLTMPPQGPSGVPPRKESEGGAHDTRAVRAAGLTGCPHNALARIGAHFRYGIGRANSGDAALGYEAANLGRRTRRTLPGGDVSITLVGNLIDQEFTE